MTKCFGYMRTSSATNCGQDKDSDKRQRAAIEAYAASNGFEIAGWYYDEAVSGADHVLTRLAFSDMIASMLANGVKAILVESPDRFARDLIVQMIGHDKLREMGITLIAATAPDFFTSDSPTATMVRQILGAVSQFEKASLVAKMKGARDRKRAATGKCEGRLGFAEMVTMPEHSDVRDAARMAYKLHGEGKTLRAISAALASIGLKCTARSGDRVPYHAKSVSKLITLALV